MLRLGCAYRQGKKKSLEQSSTALVSAWVRAEEALLSQAQQMLQQSAEEEQAHATAAADRLVALSASLPSVRVPVL